MQLTTIIPSLIMLTTATVSAYYPTFDSYSGLSRRSEEIQEELHVRDLEHFLEQRDLIDEAITNILIARVHSDDKIPKKHHAPTPSQHKDQQQHQDQRKALHDKYPPPTVNKISRKPVAGTEDKPSSKWGQKNLGGFN